jgi:hypothetical protein
MQPKDDGDSNQAGRTETEPEMQPVSAVQSGVTGG